MEEEEEKEGKKKNLHCLLISQKSGDLIQTASEALNYVL
jgi:hypothetical protein